MALHTEISAMLLPSSTRCVDESEIGPNPNSNMFWITSKKFKQFFSDP